MLSLEEYRKLANDEIAAIPYPATPNGLYEPIAYTMDLGGKVGQQAGAKRHARQIFINPPKSGLGRFFCV